MCHIFPQCTALSNALICKFSNTLLHCRLSLAFSLALAFFQPCVLCSLFGWTFFYFGTILIAMNE